VRVCFICKTETGFAKLVISALLLVLLAKLEVLKNTNKDTTMKSARKIVNDIDNCFLDDNSNVCMNSVHMKYVFRTML